MQQVGARCILRLLRMRWDRVARLLQGRQCRVQVAIVILVVAGHAEDGGIRNRCPGPPQHVRPPADVASQNDHVGLRTTRRGQILWRGVMLQMQVAENLNMHAGGEGGREQRACVRSSNARTGRTVRRFSRGDTVPLPRGLCGVGGEGTGSPLTARRVKQRPCEIHQEGGAARRGP